jgi:putative transposase
MKQLSLLKPESKSYGANLRRKRKGRGARPLAIKESMHLVLKSSHAEGDWSFKRKNNELKIKAILNKFSNRYWVKILSVANVGNHLHLHIQLTKRWSYRPFIRAITSAIAMAITGASRWKRIKIKFWDYRPFTRVIRGLNALITIKDYIAINQLEGIGVGRIEARFIIESRKNSS